MTEFMYDINSAVIAAVLFVSMALAIEAGYRIGRRSTGPAAEASKAHIDAIQASMLGILALLLAFTLSLSLSLQRFDSRSEAVVAEANSIGTASLRAQLLPAAVRGEVKGLLRQYIDLRVQAGAVTLVDRAERAALQAKTLGIQNALWGYARQATELDTNAVRSGLFIESLNDLIDNQGKREAALNRHVPEAVLLLLYATFLMAGSIVGYAAGIAGHRPSLATHVMVALIVVLVFIILDLDRPRRGLIKVNQASLIELQAAINTENKTDDRRSAPAR
jgi:hypothetical protein